MNTPESDLKTLESSDSIFESGSGTRMQIRFAASEGSHERISSALDENNASISKIVQPLPAAVATAVMPLMSERLVCLSLTRKVMVLPLSGSMNECACSTPTLIRAAGQRTLTEVFQSE